MPQRPFRFGYTTDGAATRSAWRDEVRQAEDMGFSTLLMPDHFVSAFAPLVALTDAAAVTKTLRIGTIVLDNDFRHPAFAAKEAATLDVLSNGRLELGLGAGWHAEEYMQSGIPFDAAGVRVARLGEALAVIKRFFTQETVTYAGKYYTLKDLPALPRPVQFPHPPIFVGGGGQKVLQLAAREANIIGIHVKVNRDETTDFIKTTAAGMEEKIAWIREAAGERINDLELNVLVRAAITDHPDDLAREFAKQRGWDGLTTAEIMESFSVLYGTVEQITDRLTAWRERYGISYITLINQGNLTDFAPVINRLAGK